MKKVFYWILGIIILLVLLLPGVPEEIKKMIFFVIMVSWGLYVLDERIKEIEEKNRRLEEYIDHLFEMIWDIPQTPEIKANKRNRLMDAKMFRRIKKITKEENQELISLMGIKDIDLETFKIIDNDYIKDKYHVYFRTSKKYTSSKESIDHLIDNDFGYIEDEGFWKKIENIDPDSFEQCHRVDWVLCKDKNNIYCLNKLTNQIEVMK